MVDSMTFLFSLLIFILFLVYRQIDVSKVAPAIPQPIGPARAKSALPAATPPPPAERAPPPSQARAALLAAAPERVEMAVPVEAVPNVVATHIAALGVKAATAAPPATPALALIADFVAASSSSLAKSHTLLNSFLFTCISFISASNSFGWFAILLIRFSTLSKRSIDLCL